LQGFWCNHPCSRKTPALQPQGILLMHDPSLI
jgi:hypothetical protein